jgi:hypothetical protein
MSNIEQDKRDYAELCNKVEKIDEAAAHYMRTQAPNLSWFAYDGVLLRCFVFSETPQGEDYWHRIVEEL